MEKYAVVTGGCSGIGKAIVEVLEQNGYVCFILSRSNKENAENVILCDVSKKDQVENAFIKIKEKTNHIDVVVNSAGFGSIGALELCEEDLIKKVYETNVYGTIYVIQQALPLMSAGGKIFNISSMQAISPVPYKSMYSSSKAAVSSLSFCLRNELKNSKISVCAFCPGEIKTNFTKNRIGEIKSNERYGNSIEKSIAWQDARENKRADVKVIKKAFLKQLKRKMCKPLVITPIKYKLIYFYSRLVPTKCYLNTINKTIIKK